MGEWVEETSVIERLEVLEGGGHFWRAAQSTIKSGHRRRQGEQWWFPESDPIEFFQGLTTSSSKRSRNVTSD